jgi:hypothetical protein
MAKSTPRTDFSQRKFKELILYLSEHSRDDPGFGSTKLNKLLFFCDFEAFRRLGRPITGARYQKLPWGPAAIEFLPMHDELEQESLARVEKRQRGRFTRSVTVPLAKPDLTIFSDDEIDIINEVVRDLRELDATGVSEFSHERAIGWRIANEREVIPYETAFISAEPAPSDAVDRLGARVLSGNWD